MHSWLLETLLRDTINYSWLRVSLFFVHRNAQLMKKWKNSIELIGFNRISYEKDIHFHFIAFRKVPDDFLWDVRRKNHLLLEKNLESMALHIPQDFKEYESSSSENESNLDEDCQELKENFSELPCL